MTNSNCDLGTGLYEEYTDTDEWLSSNTTDLLKAADLV